MSTHVFDQALALTAQAEGDYLGASHPAYWNMVGPYGGITAATLLNAVMQHPKRLGVPVALTVNYASALGAGPFRVVAKPVRTNRSTQHWTVELWQTDAQGDDGVVTTATALTALPRTTWGVDEVAMPAVPPPSAVPPVPLFKGVEWIQRYEVRPVSGGIPRVWDGGGTTSLSQLWVRDAEPRPLDHLSLAALCDVFYPRVWLRRATQVPAGTVSMTVYFHASAEQLDATGTGCLFAQAQAQAIRNGFFDQSAQLWNEAGQLLATSHQVVYYKA